MFVESNSCKSSGRIPLIHPQLSCHFHRITSKCTYSTIGTLKETSCRFNGKPNLFKQTTCKISSINLSLPYTYRNRCYNLRTTCTCVASFGNRDSCNILVFLKLIGHLKTICNNCMIKMPNESIDHIKINNNLLCRFNIRCHNINIIYRTAEKICQRCIVRNKINGRNIRTCVHPDLTNNGIEIAHLIADYKLDTVQSVSNGYVGNRDSATRIFAIYFHSVHIGLCRACVNTCRITLYKIGYTNFCTEGIVVNGLPLHLTHNAVIINKVQGSENRSISIIRCIRILYCNIVNKVSILTLRIYYTVIFLPLLLLIIELNIEKSSRNR